MRRLLTALALLLALAAPAAAMQKRTANVTDAGGNVIGAATVAVYVFGTTTLATIYSDNGVTPRANPIVAAPSDGSYTYYAANGRYSEVIAAPGYTFAGAQTSDLVLYDPAATASAATAAAMIPASKVILLQDYARCDGVTDDQTAITNAIAAMAFSGPGDGVQSGVMFVGHGTCMHSGTLTWPNKHFLVVGGAEGFSELQHTGSGVAHQIISDGSTIVNQFRDLRITTSGSTADVMRFTKTSRLSMQNVQIEVLGGAPTSCLKIVGDTTAAQYTKLDNVFCRGGGLAQNGFWISGSTFPGPDASLLLHSRTFQTTTCGLKIEGSTGINVYAGGYEAVGSGTGVGICLDGVRNVNIHGPWFESNGTDVQIKSTTLSTSGVTIGFIQTATTSPSINIDVQTPGTTTRSVKIIANTLTSAPTIAAIRIQSGVVGTIIAFNSCSNAVCISDAGSKTMKVANLDQSDTMTPMQSNADAGLMLISTAVGSAALPGTTKMQINSSSSGATAVPLALTNEGASAVSTATGMDFAMNFSAGADTFGRILTTATNVTGGARSGQMDVMTNVASALTTIARFAAGLQVGGTGGLPTGGDKGTGTINAAGGYYLNNSLLLGAKDTTISTGVGSVRMKSVNAATNAAWIPITTSDGTVYYVPGWTTNNP